VAAQEGIVSMNWEVAPDQLPRTFVGVLVSRDEAVRDAAPRDAVRLTYENAAASNPEFYRNYTFDQWLNFLVSYGLVAVDRNTVKIDDFGRLFVQYLAQQQLPIYRPN
jgi:hypothetical protein